MAYTTINKSTDYFNTKLYTGNGSTNAITGVGFQPDFLWIKSRSDTKNHNLWDAVRGNTKRLISNSNGAESTETSITSFDSDGFTLDSGTTSNGNSLNFASWNWKANGAGSANTDGSISSTVSVNTTAGFSIVKYVSGNASNFTIGHGLGVAPKIIIAKSLTSTSGWGVYYNLFGVNTNYLALNTTDAQGSNSADPDANGIANGGNGYTGVFATLNSTTISISAQAFANYGTNAIAYCFAEKTGYSKFGSYTGNGSTDGTFVYTGFKPSLIIQKNSGYTGNWILYDNKRDVDNVADKILIPNSSSAEASACDVDLLSNGFKFRAVNNASSNWSGNNYIYMAFGQSIVGSNNIPATAR